MVVRGEHSSAGVAGRSLVRVMVLSRRSAARFRIPGSVRLGGLGWGSGGGSPLQIREYVVADLLVVGAACGSYIGPPRRTRLVENRPASPPDRGREVLIRLRFAALTLRLVLRGPDMSPEFGCLLGFVDACMSAVPC